MLTLRLTHHADTVHTVEVQLDDDGHAERAISEFPFAYKAEDRELVRWYLEDYIAFPVDPAPTIAARAEDRLALVGADLFGKVFGGGAARLWARVRPRLADVRIEVASDGVTLPWELLRDPDSDVVLALQAGSFVRATRRRGSSVPLATSAEALRVLIVISRPDAGCDVPFRSVARQLLRAASGMAGCRFDVLRPPTWDRLGVVLAAAHRRGVPYHAMHFDGHGEYTHDRSGGSGRRGYAVFEGPGATRVDGATLGTLLAACGVGVLVLNACRSAHAEAPGTPQDRLEEQDDSDVEAYGSLADEVVDAGVSGVVAMQYNVFVDTAARFVGDLYQSILNGEELARGVTQARRRLAADPYRTIAYDSRPLQDWMVPVVFQAGPCTLVSMAPDRVDRPAPPTDDEAYAVNTAPAPDLGFFGRDETLLELDRAFDTDPVVLLTAYAGAGKSATAMEFSRWYLATDGADLALWSSFVLPLTTVELLDRLAGALATDGFVVHSRWQELSLLERLAEVRRILGARRLLWVWDNVETVGDDPDESLVSLLGELRVAKAKVLLTSRRDERPWLGDTVMRVGMPPMPMVERLQLARAVAESTGRRLDDIEDWRPLLRYTEGNPLTITLVVSQAFDQGIGASGEIVAFVNRLREGEGLADDPSLGRTASLGASLSYGFGRAFTEEERPYVGLLHLFQGFVNVLALVSMSGALDAPGSPFVALAQGPWLRLCNRAAAVGLLSPMGADCYRAHPALAWFLAPVFVATCGDGARVRHAYASAMSEMGEAYHRLYEVDAARAARLLGAEEANLLHAWRLAYAADRWERVLGAMQGLSALYINTGRTAEWARLIDEAQPLFVDPGRTEPRWDRVDGWTVLAKHRVRLAQWNRDFDGAEVLLRKRIDHDRRLAADALATSPDKLSDAQRHRLDRLSSSVHELAETLRLRRSPACVPLYREAINLIVRADEKGESILTYNLASALLEIPEVRDIDEAERLYLRSLELLPSTDAFRRALSYASLGHIAIERYDEAVAYGEAERVLQRHLADARSGYQMAENELPEGATRSWAELHYSLGVLRAKERRLDEAFNHFQRAAELEVRIGRRWGAGMARRYAAQVLIQSGRPRDALPYAQIAVSDFESLGDRAEAETEEARALVGIAEIGIEMGVGDDLID